MKRQKSRGGKEHREKRRGFMEKLTRKDTKLRRGLLGYEIKKNRKVVCSNGGGAV